MIKKTKIACFGVGYLGKFHLQQLLQNPLVEVVGFYDPNDESASYVQSKYNLNRYTVPSKLIEEADVVDIASSTTTHFELAVMCIKAGKHFFIEKPITNDVDQAKRLVSMIKESGIKCQVGYVERFNPAYRKAQTMIDNPMFVEATRLSSFSPRNKMINIIYDLMVHDIDVVLSLINSPIKDIVASGTKVISETIDIANARVVFFNGCTANFTASRLSLRKMRKMRIFQKDAYFSIDFSEKQVDIVELVKVETNKGQGQITIPIEGIEDKHIIFRQEGEKNINQNALYDELDAFIRAVREDKPTAVNEYDGLKSLEVAQQIIDKINAGAMF